MRILALETSTEFCSVALWQDGDVRAKSELVGQKHSELLLKQLDALLREVGVRVAELDGIAYGKGPGSFTGVRIACGVTQGLALGADLSVVGVCTLLALAQASAQSRVIAALDARMGEIYHAAYALQDGMWTEISAPCLCKADAAPLVEGGGWFGAGSGFAAYSEALATRYAGQLDGMDVLAVPQAAAIAVLGAAEFLAGQGVDAALAQPLYLRDKVALKTAERVALGGA